MFNLPTRGATTLARFAAAVAVPALALSLLVAVSGPTAALASPAESCQTVNGHLRCAEPHHGNGNGSGSAESSDQSDSSQGGSASPSGGPAISCHSIIALPGGGTQPTGCNHELQPTPTTSSGNTGSPTIGCQLVISLPDGGQWSPCNPSLNHGVPRPGSFGVNEYRYGQCIVYSYSDGRVVPVCDDTSH